MVLTFRSWLDLLDVVLVFWMSLQKIIENVKLLSQGNRYDRLRKTFGKFFGPFFEIMSKFGKLSFQEYETLTRPSTVL